MVHLILASNSPRRKKLLSQLGLSFEVIPSNIEENFDSDRDPAEIVETLAHQKALSVASERAHSLVIAADTLVVLNGSILGQPADESEARQMLRNLSGNTHDVFTGVALIRTGGDAKITKELCFHERTKVTFTTLTEREIDQYVRSGSPMDKAGAYGIQDDRGSLFISGIEGDYYNVVGFPLHKFYQNMKQIAPEIVNQAHMQTS